MVPTVLGMVSEMEPSFIIDRQRIGIEAEKLKGVYKGRPTSVDHDDLVKKLRNDGMGATVIAKQVGFTRRAVRNVLKGGSSSR